MKMKISSKGIDLIKKYEGCKLFAYRDSVGVPTIGYGHTRGVTMGMAITKDIADRLLLDDIASCENAINALGVTLKQNQFDALCSWIFNLGTGNFNSSTLKKKIVSRSGDNEIAEQMIRWVNAGGKPLLGLKRRRTEEANMWLGKELYKVDSTQKIVKI